MVYLATAPKSNAIYAGYGRVQAAIAKTGTLPVPLPIRNAPTKLMKDLEYGKGYLYAHDYTEFLMREGNKGLKLDLKPIAKMVSYVPQDYLPDELRGQGLQFYRPTERGYEKIIGERLEQWRRIREANAKKDKI